jgi:hypothetical protein
MRWISMAAVAATVVSAAAVGLTVPAHAATTRYEAEAAPAVCGGSVASNHAGYSGSGFCDTTNAVPGNGWNPADIDNSGNEWDNMAVFDNRGRLNPNIRWLP